MNSKPTFRVARRGGVSLLWVVVAMTFFCAFGSLAVDYGRLQVVKSELRRAADAAARAAASSLSQPNAARRLALEYAERNLADGSPVKLLADEDVELGTWDQSSRQFAPLSDARESYANAVRVTARRIKARSTAVPLMWAAMLGQHTCDVEAVSIVSTGGAAYGVIGLDSVSLQGNSTSSYWSSGLGGDGSMGSVASNGNITLGGNATINGDARPGIGMSVIGGKVTGSTEPLDTVLSFPPGDAGVYATVNDNGMLPKWATAGQDLNVGKNRNLTLPAGAYYFKDVRVAASATLEFLGPTTIYCWGTFEMGGKAETTADLPGNLKIVMCPGPQGQTPGALTISSSSALYAQIYAPQSDVAIGGTGDIYGAVLGKTVDMSGTGRIHYDLSLHTGGGIVMVK